MLAQLCSKGTPGYREREKMNEWIFDQYQGCWNYFIPLLHAWLVLRLTLIVLLCNKVAVVREKFWTSEPSGFIGYVIGILYETFQKVLNLINWVVIWLFSLLHVHWQSTIFLLCFLSVILSLQIQIRPKTSKCDLKWNCFLQMLILSFCFCLFYRITSPSLRSHDVESAVWQTHWTSTLFTVQSY